MIRSLLRRKGISHFQNNEERIDDDHYHVLYRNALICLEASLASHLAATQSTSELLEELYRTENSLSRLTFGVKNAAYVIEYLLLDFGKFVPKLQCDRVIFVFYLGGPLCYKAYIYFDDEGLLKVSMTGFEAFLYRCLLRESIGFFSPLSLMCYLSFCGSRSAQSFLELSP